MVKFCLYFEGFADGLDTRNKRESEVQNDSWPWEVVRMERIALVREDVREQWEAIWLSFHSRD